MKTRMFNQFLAECGVPRVALLTAIVVTFNDMNKKWITMQLDSIENYTVRAVLMKNHTRVWRYFAKHKCDFSLILRGKV